MSKARLNQIGQDLFWNFFDIETGNMIAWQGYDDSFRWNKISISDQFRNKDGFTLNPYSCEVTKDENGS